jgi:hypothetical protein
VIDHAIPGFDGKDFDMVGAIFSEEGEEFVEEKWSRENRWAGIVEKSVAPKDAGAAAVVGLALEEGNGMAEGSQAEGSGDSAKAGTNDESASGRRCRGHRPLLGVTGVAAR